MSRCCGPLKLRPEGGRRQRARPHVVDDPLARANPDQLTLLRRTGDGGSHVSPCIAFYTLPGSGPVQPETVGLATLLVHYSPEAGHFNP